MKQSDESGLLDKVKKWKWFDLEAVELMLSTEKSISKKMSCIKRSHPGIYLFLLDYLN